MSGIRQDTLEACKIVAPWDARKLDDAICIKHDIEAWTINGFRRLQFAEPFAAKWCKQMKRLIIAAGQRSRLRGIMPIAPRYQCID